MIVKVSKDELFPEYVPFCEHETYLTVDYEIDLTEKELADWKKARDVFYSWQETSFHCYF